MGQVATDLRGVSSFLGRGTGFTGAARGNQRRASCVSCRGFETENLDTSSFGSRGGAMSTPRILPPPSAPAPSFSRRLQQLRNDHDVYPRRAPRRWRIPSPAKGCRTRHRKSPATGVSFRRAGNGVRPPVSTSIRRTDTSGATSAAARALTGRGAGVDCDTNPSIRSSNSIATPARCWRTSAKV